MKKTIKKCKFGHPLKKNNLKEGKCGTCDLIANFKDMERHLGKIDNKLSKTLLDIIVMLEGGHIVYDRNGKTLMEWENELKKL